MNQTLSETILRNAFNGETFVFPGRQLDPAQAEFMVHLDPGGTGGGNALVHVHPVADETFTVLSGRLEIVMDGKHEMLYPGESMTISRGRPHFFSNSDKGRTIASVRFSPPQKHLQFFADFARLTQERPMWFSVKGDRRTRDGHRAAARPPALQSARAGGGATVELHHHPGHDHCSLLGRAEGPAPRQPRPPTRCAQCKVVRKQRLARHPGRDAGFTLRPPDRSERALLTHSAPTSGV